KRLSSLPGRGRPSSSIWPGVLCYTCSVFFEGWLLFIGPWRRQVPPPRARAMGWRLILNHNIIPRTAVEDVHARTALQHIVAVAASTHHDDRIRLVVARVRVRGTRQVEVDIGDASAGQVADRYHVRAAFGVEQDDLDAVAVHDDAADVARKSQALAVGGDVYRL